MKAAVVETATNIVVNTIMADASKDLPPDDCFLVDITEKQCDIGWIYDPATGTFSAPEPVL
jgi:hypothetical protein